MNYRVSHTGLSSITFKAVKIGSGYQRGFNLQSAMRNQNCNVLSILNLLIGYRVISLSTHSLQTIWEMKLPRWPIVWFCNLLFFPGWRCWVKPRMGCVAHIPKSACALTLTIAGLTLAIIAAVSQSLSRAGHNMGVFVTTFPWHT